MTLTCSPTQFTFDLAKMPSTRTMRLSNFGSEKIAFKVMTTSRDRYRVKPTSGVLEPGQAADVLLILSTSGEIPADVISAWAKDKFMVKSMTVAPGSSEADVKERWASASSSEVKQVRLQCAHRLPSAEEAAEDAAEPGGGGAEELPEQPAPAPAPAPATAPAPAPAPAPEEEVPNLDAAPAPEQPPPEEPPWLREASAAAAAEAEAEAGAAQVKGQKEDEDDEDDEEDEEKREEEEEPAWLREAASPPPDAAAVDGGGLFSPEQPAWLTAAEVLVERAVCRLPAEDTAPCA